LFEEFFHLPGGFGVDREWTESVDAEVMALGVGKCANKDEEVRDALAEDFRALLLDATLGTQQKIARLG
jgi:hypothetical protein